MTDELRLSKSYNAQERIVIGVTDKGEILLIATESEGEYSMNSE